MPRQGSPSDDGRQRRGYFNWEKSRAGGLLLDWLEDPDNSTRWKTAARACRDGELRGSGPTKNALVNEIVKFLKTNGETGLTTKQVKNKMFNYERSYWAAKKLRKRAAAKEQDADEEDGRVKRPRGLHLVSTDTMAYPDLGTVFPPLNFAKTGITKRGAHNKKSLTVRARGGDNDDEGGRCSFSLKPYFLTIVTRRQAILQQVQ